MKVFITGGSGYIGRATVEALVRRGTHVTALVRGDASAQAVSGLGAVPVRGALTDLAVLRDAARASDGVIHLAQHYGTDTAEVDRAAAEALQDGATPRPYVHTDGVWVYGDTDGVVDEDAPLSPPRLTAWRLENEKRVLARAATGERPVIVMPGLVHGRSGGPVETFYAAPGRTTGAVPCVGEGSNHWALVHVEDVAELYALALAAPAGSVYAGVSDQNPTAKEVAEVVSQAIGHPGAVQRLTAEEAEARMGPIAEAFGPGGGKPRGPRSPQAPLLRRGRRGAALRAGRRAAAHRPAGPVPPDLDLATDRLLQPVEAVPEWHDLAVREGTRTSGEPATRTVEEKLEHVATGHGVVVLPLSTATFYTRPDIVHVKITNLAPNEVCLAWDAARPRHLVEEFATIATTHRATATTTS